MKFLAFLLGDGALYLPSKRAIEVWDVLIHNSQACDMDRDVSFNLEFTFYFEYVNINTLFVCLCVCACVCVHVHVYACLSEGNTMSGG